VHRSVFVSIALSVFILAVGSLGGERAGSAPAEPEKPAANTAEPDSGKEKKKPKERKMKLEAESVDYDEATTTYIAVLATVELPDSDATLRADRIEWNRGEKWMRATGKPRMWDPQNEIVADVIHADLDVKRANAEGNVRLTARPKEAKTETGKKARSRVKEPVVVHCDTMQYFYKARKGTAAGHLRLTQKDEKADRTATAERLAYDGNDETVILEGSVKVDNTRGEGFTCKQAIITIKDGAEGFQVKGLTGGVFYVQEDEEEEEGDEKPKPAAPAPPG
jgi:lipopolysaccharide export system protein LptA